MRAPGCKTGPACPGTAASTCQDTSRHRRSSYEGDLVAVVLAVAMEGAVMAEIAAAGVVLVVGMVAAEVATWLATWSETCLPTHPS